MATQSNQRPSQIINLTNDYEAFCFDEACYYIISELNKKNPKEPKFIIDKEDSESHNNNDDLIDFLAQNNAKITNVKEEK